MLWNQLYPTHLLNAAWLDSDKQRRRQFQGPSCSRVQPFAAASESKQLGAWNYALLLYAILEKFTKTRQSQNEAVSSHFPQILTKEPANAPSQSNADVEKGMALDSLMIE